MRKKQQTMDFGAALRALKIGRWVARKGWNGKRMHLYMEDLFIVPNSVAVARGTAGAYEPCIVMFTADEKHQPGWLASQADMLAEDWIIVERLKGRRR